MICHLRLLIHLTVTNRGEVVSGVQVDIELFKGLVIELLVIVNNDSIKEPKAAHNRLLEEGLNLALWDMH